MRRLTLAVVVGAFMMSTSSASAQAMEEGNVGIDLYYGFPNLYTSVFRAAYTNSTTDEDIKVGGIGPLGLRGEYMIADKFGIGIDFGFTNSKVTYSRATTVYNPVTLTNDPITYDFDFRTRKIGFMVVFNYHFIDNDQVDFFGTLGTGYKNRSFSFTSTDPLYNEDNISVTLVPVSFRMGLGMRYFFTDNIGINLGLGFGQGGIANAGVSFKL